MSDENRDEGVYVEEEEEIDESVRKTPLGDS